MKMKTKNRLTSAAVLILAGALSLGACATGSVSGAAQKIEICQEALDEAEYVFSILGDAIEQGTIGMTAAAGRDSSTLHQVSATVDGLTAKLEKSNYEELAKKCRA